MQEIYSDYIKQVSAEYDGVLVCKDGAEVPINKYIMRCRVPMLRIGEPLDYDREVVQLLVNYAMKAEFPGPKTYYSQLIRLIKLSTDCENTVIAGYAFALLIDRMARSDSLDLLLIRYARETLGEAMAKRLMQEYENEKQRRVGSRYVKLALGVFALFALGFILRWQD